MDTSFPPNQSAFAQPAFYFIVGFLALMIGAMALNGTSAAQKGDYPALREEMVKKQIEARGIKNERLLAALRKVERHLFMPASVRPMAYVDSALPIENNQTISQPYIVAIMTERLDPQPTDKVLEIGAGSGYQAAILGELVQDVYTIEIVEPLGKKAEKLLQELGYKNVHVRIGDGYKGWPEHAPFDKIIVTAAPEKVPQPLIDQLKIGGRMVIPVGERNQELMLLTKDKNGIKTEEIFAVRFVPMTGEAQKQ